jgi:hypothetical protein
LLTDGCWRYLGASVAGTSHILRNIPCQDSEEFQIIGESTVVIAVADGAGSAERSAEGSRAAALTATAFITDRLHAAQLDSAKAWNGLLEEALKEARAALEQLAGTDLRPVATTLLLAIATPEWLATAQLGDGGIVGEFRFDELRVFSRPGSAEYINETVFLTSPDFLTQAHYTVSAAQDLTAIALFSDGLQLLAMQYADNTAHKPFFGPVFEFASRPDATVEELAEFLRSERVCERTDDDKTLSVAVRSDLPRPER